MIRRSTDRFVVAVVASVAGALVAIAAGLPEAVLLVAPWMVLSILGITGARRQELGGALSIENRRVVVGDEFDVTATVTGAVGMLQLTFRPGRAFGPPTRAVDPRAFTVSDVAPGRGVVVTDCTVRAHRWGRHEVGTVDAVVDEPYGLFRWTATLDRSTDIWVHPTPTELRELLAPRLVRRTSGTHRSTAVDRGVEYADIRRFQPGDSLRDINWRASARSEDLWASQRHPDRATDVVLLLDSFIEPGHDVNTIVGLSVEACLALADSHLSVTDRVGLIELGGVVRWVSPRTGQLQLQMLTDALLSTRLFANAAEKGLQNIPPRALPPRSFVVALTPLTDRRFIDVLFVLAGGGHDVAVIECSPLIGTGIDPEQPQESRSADIAMQVWQAERHAVRDRMTAHGIVVGTWRQGEHLDVVLGELIRRRSRMAHR